MKNCASVKFFLKLSMVFILIFVFSSFIELEKIPLKNLTKKTDIDFVNKTKESLKKFSESIWTFSELMNDTDLTKDDVVQKHVKAIKESWSKASESLKAAAAPEEKDLAFIKGEFKTALDDAVKYSDKFPLIKSSAKESITPDIKTNIEKSLKIFTDANKKASVILKKYYGVSLPEIPQDKENYYLLKAERYFLEKNSDEAFKQIGKVLAINQENFMANKLKGMLYSRAKDYKTAEQSYIKALSSNLNDPELYYEIGIILEAQKKYEDALNSYEVGLKINPAFAKALYKCGVIMIENDLNAETGKSRLKNFLETAKAAESTEITPEMITKAEKLLKK